MRRPLATTLMAVIVATLTAACGTAEPSRSVDPPRTFGSPSAISPTASAPVDVSPGVADDDRAAIEEVAARFATAANAGDEEAVAALFAPDARFDSVGRIYPSRDDIMTRFLVPEVLRVGGRYEPGERRWDGTRLTVTYRFTTASGGREEFTYAYLVRDGLIRDVVGRYL
ncbi:nuclear transport factor 2 family protein [Plantactinospora endophytica]|uniref:SnoaL-like domain-containing protein n=1 Tax=Plantactinospora endophytica TaxID=673535 RepID=A0ABQ4E8S3_9ACTN|nr:nuclear transport factor 2 family protein [Plantactinospora endophytica]GIG91136.1 hypothetical protein Pen02_60720 [Plantactinospora endophytica]